MNRNHWIAAALAIAVAALPACSKQDGQPEPEKKTAIETQRKPVELSVYYMGSDQDYDRFMDVYGKYMQKKHPHLSFKWMNNKDSTKFADAVATRVKIDLFYGTGSSYRDIVQAGYANFDITELTKTYKLNLSSIEPATLDYFKKINKGTLNALPITLLHSVLIYNKDLFDKFAVPYLQDGMTWEQLYSSAQKLTRQDGGVQYAGFGFQRLSSYWGNNQYGEEMIDASTGKAKLSGGKWPDMFRQFSLFFQIPGNTYVAATPTFDMFIKEKRLAMNVMLNSQAASPTVIPDEIRYDVVQLPVFRDTVGVGAGVSPYYFSVSSTSEHREDAYLAMSELVSLDVQTDRAKTAGSFPVLSIPKLETILASELPRMKGKNVKGLIPSKFAPILLPDPAGVSPAGNLDAAFSSVVKGEKDINTALRDAGELTEKQLAASKAAGAK
ncbi:MAG: hypothetical protein K0Q59_3579 [Paenibacillus sp.]|jgi:multiple sugar transport system substrate-binding protein|nr:hypothetical protein [Paenibacillus sp.]